MNFERRRWMRAALGATLAAGALPRCSPSPAAGADASGADASGADSAAPPADAGRESGADAGCVARASEFGPGDGAFRHGVASGDPTPDAVILWTRVTPSADEGEVEVSYELSTTRTFDRVERSGTVRTSAARDFTVKVDANGLRPGTTYFYRFNARGERSPMGRTRTAPGDATARARFAVVSCSSYAHGYFHAYRALARRADLDAVVHLGDYIYEYASALDAPCFGATYGAVRPYDPPHELTTLEDYRRRYAHYRRDPDLQDAHRQHPFIAVWDDHEFADNAYPNGAENHQASEGDWSARRRAATQAYAEWMPIREQMDGRIYRRLRFGSLVDLIMLDTRIEGRDAQVSGPNAADRTAMMRQLLGAQQEQWLRTQLLDAGARWKLLGQQVMMAPVIDQFPNVDQWDGYPAARQRVFEMLSSGGVRDVVVLTGDVHSSWAWNLVPEGVSFDPTTGAGAIAVEFVVPAVSAPGTTRAVSDILAPSIRAAHPELTFVDLYRRGFVILDVDELRVQAAWYLFERIESPAAQTERVEAVRSVRRGAPWLREDAEPATPREDAPPLAP